jgi:hypothetical protein
MRTLACARRRSDRVFMGDEIGKVQANCNGCGSEWDNQPRLRSARCTAMSGSGSRIVSMKTTMERHQTGRHG